MRLQPLTARTEIAETTKGELGIWFSIPKSGAEFEFFWWQKTPNQQPCCVQCENLEAKQASEDLIKSASTMDHASSPSRFPKPPNFRAGVLLSTIRLHEHV